MNPRDNSKSVGPTLRDLKIPKDQAFLKGDDGRYTVHPVILAEMVALEEHLRGDEPLKPIRVQACIKNEVYPKDKADVGKARYFYVVDVWVNLVLRKLLLPILSFLMDNPYKSRIATMLNATGSDWHRMFEFLTRSQGSDWKDSPLLDRFFGCDQKSFDLSHCSLWDGVVSVFSSLAKNLGYSANDCHAVRRSVQMIRHCVMEMEGNVSFVWDILCSGLALTIHFNSISNELLWRSIYYQKFPLAKIDAYDREVRTMNCGDDCVGTTVIDPSIFQDLSRFWGYEVTDDTKKKTVSLVKYSDVTFLKRRFVFRYGRIVGPLDRQSIYKALAYVSGVKPKEEDARNINTVLGQLRECVLHGPELYNHVLTASTRVYPQLTKFTVSYEDMLDQWNMVPNWVTWGLPEVV
jgi:hypothetical protein